MQETTGPVVVNPGEILECNEKSKTCSVYTMVDGNRLILGQKGKFSGIEAITARDATVTTGIKRAVSRSGTVVDRKFTRIIPEARPITCSKKGNELSCKMR